MKLAAVNPGADYRVLFDCLAEFLVITVAANLVAALDLFAGDCSLKQDTAIMTPRPLL